MKYTAAREWNDRRRARGSRSRTYSRIVSCTTTPPEMVGASRFFAWSPWTAACHSSEKQ